MNLSAVVFANTAVVKFMASLDNTAYEFVVDNLTTTGRVWFTVTYDV
jgi:hypothetical protein